MILHPTKNKKSTLINIYDWKEQCPPKSEIHWKDKRSAKEMAKFWVETENQQKIVSFLSQSSQVVNLEYGIPEMAMKFDNYKSPRKTDLAIFGEINSKKTLISIEGKADESYGENLFKDEFIQSIMTKAITPNSKKLNRCIELFQRFNSVSEVLNIRYQLLYWLAGTIEEAVSNNIDTIFLISQEFHSDETADININRNKLDFDFFISLISKGTKITPSDNFIVGPFNNEFTKGINVYFGKYVVCLK